MATNYAQAARRHYDDSRTLAAQRRSGNTSHLAGLAAECALKAVLQGLGVLKLGPKSIPIDRKHQTHINVLWGEFQTALTGPKANLYMLPGANPFAGWRIEGRYEEDATIDVVTAEAHRVGAYKAMLILERARQERDVR